MKVVKYVIGILAALFVAVHVVHLITDFSGGGISVEGTGGAHLGGRIFAILIGAVVALTCFKKPAA